MNGREQREWHDRDWKCLADRFAKALVEKKSKLENQVTWLWRGPDVWLGRLLAIESQELEKSFWKGSKHHELSYCSLKESLQALQYAQALQVLFKHFQHVRWPITSDGSLYLSCLTCAVSWEYLLKILSSVASFLYDGPLPYPHENLHTICVWIFSLNRQLQALLIGDQRP